MYTLGETFDTFQTTLQADTDRLIKLFNRLNLNAEICYTLKISTSGKLNQSSYLSVSICNTDISCVMDAKYIRVYLEQVYLL